MAPQIENQFRAKGMKSVRMKENTHTHKRSPKTRKWNRKEFPLSYQWNNEVEIRKEKKTRKNWTATLSHFKVENVPNTNYKTWKKKKLKTKQENISQMFWESKSEYKAMKKGKKDESRLFSLLFSFEHLYWEVMAEKNKWMRVAKVSQRFLRFFFSFRLFGKRRNKQGIRMKKTNTRADAPLHFGISFPWNNFNSKYFTKLFFFLLAICFLVSFRFAVIILTCCSNNNSFSRILFVFLFVSLQFLCNF